MKKLAREFTTASGIQINLVPVAEDQFDQLITSAAAADDLPDVIGALPLPSVRSLSTNDLLNTDISTDPSVTNELPIDELPVKVDFTHEDGYPYGPVTGPVERADPPPTWDTNPPPTDVIDPPPTGEIDPPVVSPVIGIPGPTPVADDTTLEA
jgi:ABC-type glycerol-3-phosphate transport system substrate-binding protein